jgi:YspA, cpYpsA-related SLOG family
VLVYGGRGYSDRATLFRVLDELSATTIISGGASGADTLAEHWTYERGVPVVRYPADWARHGNAAGLVRNQQMLDDGKPDLAVAFPGGKGTADMVRRARKAGIPIKIIA